MGYVYKNLTPDEVTQLEFQAGNLAARKFDEIASKAQETDAAIAALPTEVSPSLALTRRVLVPDFKPTTLNGVEASKAGNQIFLQYKSTNAQGFRLDISGNAKASSKVAPTDDGFAASISVDNLVAINRCNPLKIAVTGLRSAFDGSRYLRMQYCTVADGAITALGAYNDIALDDAANTIVVSGYDVDDDATHFLLSIYSSSSAAWGVSNPSVITIDFAERPAAEAGSSEET